MDKMEILKLALAHAPDPKSAMELAREMEAFLKGPPPAPRWVAETITAMSEPQQKTPETPSGKPRKNRHPWTQQDLVSLQDLISKNYAIQNMPMILGRSLASIKTAIARLKSPRVRGARHPTRRANRRPAIRRSGSGPVPSGPGG